MCYLLLRMRYLLLVASLCAFIAAPITAQEKAGPPLRGWTFYPPSVYMQFFQACSPEKPCSRTDDFRVDPLPKGCCILSLTNGDGKGNDEVHAYEVFLNGKRVLPEGELRSAQATVSVHTNNTIRVVLTGKPSAKIFVLIAYDPRQPKQP
jgi:hypothetical protein